MFGHSLKINLALRNTVRLLPKQAHDSKDPKIILVICNIASWLLATLKSVAKRHSRSTSFSGAIHNIDLEQETLLFQDIASAYLDHANLMGNLGHANMTQESRRRAESLG